MFEFWLLLIILTRYLIQMINIICVFINSIFLEECWIRYTKKLCEFQVNSSSHSETHNKTNILMHITLFIITRIRIWLYGSIPVLKIIISDYKCMQIPFEEHKITSSRIWSKRQTRKTEGRRINAFCQTFLSNVRRKLFLLPWYIALS